MRLRSSCFVTGTSPARRNKAHRLLMPPTSQQAYLGIDAGGTHTRAVVVDRAGRRSHGAAGPANWTTLGREPCVAAIREGVGEALTAHGLRPSELAGACIALAGYYPPWHQREARAALGQLLPGVRLRVEPDLIAAWAGATGGGPGMVLVAGTGAVAYGRDAAGQSARAGGWGPLFGDEGSGYWIGCEGLRAVARSVDGRGPATTLAERLWVSDGAQDAAPPPSVEQRLRAVYRDQWPRDRVAGLAVVVAQEAAAGDEVAIGILEQAAAELSVLVTAVARQLSWTDEPLGLVGVGGVLEADAAVRDPLERCLVETLPNAFWRSPAGSPLEGALLLALSEEPL
jgi:glucosamine kinase